MSELQITLKGCIYMKKDYLLLPISLQNSQTTNAVRNCNEITMKYGLQLYEPDIQFLIENRKESLQKYGRIEFGGGVLQKIIIEFSDSPYLYQDNYADTLAELQEIFYYFKNETLDELPDNELIHIMKKYFDDICQGSTEYLKETILENYCRDLRYGEKGYQDIDGYEEDYTHFLDYDREEWEW